MNNSQDVLNGVDTEDLLRTLISRGSVKIIPKADRVADKALKVTLNTEDVYAEILLTSPSVRVLID